jgi:hypothetical protein
MNQYKGRNYSCNSLDRSPEIYAEWKKQSMWFHLCNIFKWQNLEMENSLVVPKLRDGRGLEGLLKKVV